MDAPPLLPPSIGTSWCPETVLGGALLLVVVPWLLEDVWVSEHQSAKTLAWWPQI